MIFDTPPSALQQALKAPQKNTKKRKIKPDDATDIFNDNKCSEKNQPFSANMENLGLTLQRKLSAHLEND
jgi:hypothetical protein